jgi:16S rRNA (uracil1498-N3)-methyltransferase
MAHLYFTEAPISPDSEKARISGEEARHAAKVARLRVGERVWLSDGLGTKAVAFATSIDSGLVDFAIESIVFAEPPRPNFVLVQALAKGDRDERAVQQATELGVAEIIPWEAERSVSTWSQEKAVRGVERWTTIAREAAKQSLRSRIPLIQGKVSTKQLAELVDGKPAIVLHPGGSVALGEWVKKSGINAEAVYLIVGPEGGVSETEIALLEKAGAKTVRLGEEVLRTSTAGPAALAALHALLGKW